MTAPLAGIRILDLTRWLAGPLATSLLGDMGADVIKIEKLADGDGTRDVDRIFVQGLSSYHLGLNRSKRSVALDIGAAEGQEIIRRLAATADVLVENFRPDVMPNLGLGYEDLQPANPRLVYCSISSFGPTGPLRGKAGMDLVVQAMGGVMGLTGTPGGVPMRVGAPIADVVGAYQAVVGVTLGLLARVQTGKGQKVDIALLDGQLSLVANYVPGFFMTGQPSGPVGVTHPQLVPYQLFAAADGNIIIACLTEEFWRRLCRTVHLEELIDDPRFRSNSDRVAHRAELTPIIEAVVKRYSTTDLAAMLDSADVPNAPIYSLGELLAHPQVKENQMVLEMTHPRAGSYKTIGIPVKLRGTPGEVCRPAPELGEHTREILMELGLEEQQLNRLYRNGVIAQWEPPDAGPSAS